VGSATTAFDVWFVWTAPSTGVVQLSTCALTTVDTRVLFWDRLVVGGCPINGAGLLACNDDLSPSVDQSKVVSDVVAGREYLVQLGTYGGSTQNPPAGGGGGAFSIEYVPLPDPTPCFADDGDSEAAVRLTNHPAYGQCMLVRHGTIGSTARVSAIEVAWGSPVNAAASTLVNGTKTSVALWEDPNDDGNPNDAVLLEEQRTSVQNHDTDILNVVPLRSTYLVSGYYFVGAIYPSDPGYPTSVGPTPYPFALDWDNLEVLPAAGAGTLSTASYYQLILRTFGVVRFGFVDAANLGYVVGGPDSSPYIGGVAVGNNAIAYNNIALVRPVCAPEVGQSICSADTLGLDHTTPCPCGNNGNPGNGCANSFNPGGARITAYGDILDDTFPAPGRTPVVLRASGLPATSYAMFLQHDSSGDTVFHDGVLCASGSLLRLRGRNAGLSQFQPAGVALFPNNAFTNDSTLTLSSRGNVTVGSGLTRYYSAWYRNASQSFCPPATANVTNGLVISW